MDSGIAGGAGLRYFRRSVVFSSDKSHKRTRDRSASDDSSVEISNVARRARMLLPMSTGEERRRRLDRLAAGDIHFKTLGWRTTLRYDSPTPPDQYARSLVGGLRIRLTDEPIDLLCADGSRVSCPAGELLECVEAVIRSGEDCDFAKLLRLVRRRGVVVDADEKSVHHDLIVLAAMVFAERDGISQELALECAQRIARAGLTYWAEVVTWSSDRGFHMPWRRDYLSADGKTIPEVFAETGSLSEAFLCVAENQPQVF